MASQFLGLYPDQWQAIGSISTALAVVAALLIAIFQEKMRFWFHRPRLKAHIEAGPPYCHKTLMAAGPVTAQCYYFRIKVENAGARQAKGVQILASELLELKNGRYISYSRFLPMHLTWSHDRSITQSIPAHMSRYCDLGHIIDPQARPHILGEDFTITFAELFFGHEIQEETIFCFDTEVKPFTSSHLIPSGEYRIVLQIGAEDTRTLRTHVDISFDGRWHMNEQEMLTRGISLKLHK